jgi:hypothetical protein
MAELKNAGRVERLTFPFGVLHIMACHKNSTSHVPIKTSPATIAKTMHQVSRLELHRAIDATHHTQAHACMTRTLILTLIMLSFPAH